MSRCSVRELFELEPEVQERKKAPEQLGESHPEASKTSENPLLEYFIKHIADLKEAQRANKDLASACNAAAERFVRYLSEIEESPYDGLIVELADPKKPSGTVRAAVQLQSRGHHTRLRDGALITIEPSTDMSGVLMSMTEVAMRSPENLFLDMFAKFLAGYIEIREQPST